MQQKFFQYNYTIIRDLVFDKISSYLWLPFLRPVHYDNQKKEKLLSSLVQTVNL